jgi:hypothetical protein
MSRPKENRIPDCAVVLTGHWTRRGQPVRTQVVHPARSRYGTGLSGRLLISYLTDISLSRDGPNRSLIALRPDTGAMNGSSILAPVAACGHVTKSGP